MINDYKLKSLLREMAASCDKINKYKNLEIERNMFLRKTIVIPISPADDQKR